MTPSLARSRARPRSAAAARPASAADRVDPGYVSAAGQATVELLGVLPAVLLTALVVFQILALGYAKVLAGNAAEAGAIAAAADADARAAAREAVPGWSRARMRVASRGGVVRVRMRPPSPLRPVARALEVEASAAVDR